MGLKHARRPRAEKQERVQESARPSWQASPEILALALQQSAGNAVAARLLRQTAVRGGIEQGSRYADAQQALEAFLATTPLRREKYRSPSIGLGFFDVEFSPPVLILDVKLSFSFVPGTAGQFPHAKAEDLLWKQGEAERYKEQWVKNAMELWKPGIFTFYCQREGWESLKATVLPVFAVDDADPHFTCAVTKVPPGQAATAAFRSETAGPTVVTTTSPRTGTTVEFFPQTSHFGSRDVESMKKPGGTQRTGVHEAGHMLGLGDEYVDLERGHLKGQEVEHSQLAEHQLGEKVLYETSDTIMSGGEKVLPRHSVTFREALETVSGIREWALTPKAPMAPGIDPSRIEPTPAPAGSERIA
jgi:hypothetical protein